MRNLTLAIIPLFALLISCGLDLGTVGTDAPNDPPTYDPGTDNPPITRTRKNGSGTEGGEVENDYSDITVTKRRCVYSIYKTTWQYISIAYPNGDKDVFCEVNWYGNEVKYYSSGHRFAERGVCHLVYNNVGYWRMNELNGDWAEFQWYGAAPAEDSHVNNAKLPNEMQFGCVVEEYIDENWDINYYEFGNQKYW